MYTEHDKKTTVTLLTGDVTLGLERLLATEIDIRPLWTIKKNCISLSDGVHVTQHKKCVLNSDVKP